MKKFMVLVCSCFILFVMSSPVLAAKEDTKVPVITKTNPTKDSMDIMIESPIFIRFSEKIQKGNTISKIIFKEIGSKKTTPYTYEISKNMLIILPKTNMKYGTEYSITIPSGAIKDMSGNILESKYTYNFITEVDSILPKEETEDSINYNIEINASIIGGFTEKKEASFFKALKSIGITSSITSINGVSSYNVVLEVAGENSIQVINAVKGYTGLPLAEARDLVYSAPTVIISDVTRDYGNTVIKSLKELGAVVSLVGVDKGAAEEINEDETPNEGNLQNYNVILEDYGTNSNGVIAALRSVIEVSLSEAYNMIHNTPVIVMEDISEADALKIVRILEDAGATVSLEGVE